jgi:hypothetical protein
MTAGSAVVQGAGTLTVSGAFLKTSDVPPYTLFVKNQGGENSGLPSADLVLNGPATHAAGDISACGNEGVLGDRPHLEINDTYTIEAGTPTAPFGCSSAASADANIQINPGGELIYDGAGVKQSNTRIENDGTLTAETGEFILIHGTGSGASDGDYVAEAGATLELGGGGSQFQIGTTGTIGGEGTVDLNTDLMTMAAGSEIDPAVLNLLFGELRPMTGASRRPDPARSGSRTSAAGPAPTSS